MAFESVRSYIQLASGLGEMTKARAMEAAQGLLTLPGADEVTRRAVQATALADQLLDAARANRANLVALVQAEVETALKRADVARVADLEAARATLSVISAELADLRATVLATGASAVAGATRSSRSRGERPASSAVTTRQPSAPAAAKKATAKKATAKKATAKKVTAKKATAKKATAKKATAKKATAKKATAKKAGS